MSEPTFVKIGREEFDGFYPKIRNFLEQDYMDVVIDAVKIRGYRSPDAKSVWIRDHGDMLRGARYHETDVKSAITHFADTQGANGRVLDYFTVYPEKLPGEKENWTKYVRVPVEADVEYRFVKAAFLAWQACGDDEWIKGLIPNMEKAMGYATTHPWRWDEERGLVKRAYTLDTWDFAYPPLAEDALQFRIDDSTIWGIMHGDNSGFYEAFRILAMLHDYFDDSARAGGWNSRAQDLQKRMNELCWNGRFYTHFVKFEPHEIPGVDESTQLSLSNPMNINRGATTHEMAVSIIKEYLARRETSDAFAEWFSMEPPFPDGIFGDAKLVGGAYANGGIMPLVGGELARAAFEHGFEEYGVDILRRYNEMITTTGETYLWYFPDGTHADIETSTSPDAIPTDGWGSSAMLYAFIEGLAGIQDRLKLFEKVRLAPRWPAAGVERVEAGAGYGSSGASFGYDYEIIDDKIKIQVRAKKSDVDFHVMTPKGTRADAVRADGADVPFENVFVEKSAYADFSLKVNGNAFVEIEITRGD